MLKVYTKLLTFVFVVSFVLSFAGVIIFALSFKEALGSDFVSFLTGSYIIREGQTELFYDIKTQYNYQQKVIYPHKETLLLPLVSLPIIAFITLPFSYFPLMTAYKLFLLFLFFIALISVVFIRKIYVNISNKLFWYLLPLMFYPSFGSIFVGQVTQIILLILFLIIYTLKRKKIWWTGFLTGLLLIKLQYIIITPFLFFIVKRKNEFIKGFLTSSISILSVIILATGTLLYDYIDFLFSTQSAEFGARFEDMFTLHATLAQISFLSQLSYFHLFIINTAAYIISLINFAKLKTHSLNILFSIAVIYTLVFSVHGVNYDYALILIPILSLADALLNNRRNNIEFATSLILLVYLPILFLVGKSIYISIFLIFTTFLLIKGMKKKKDIQFNPVGSQP